jgi:hypothetical protein
MRCKAPQGGAIEGNAADDALMVIRGPSFLLTDDNLSYILASNHLALSA